MYQYKTIILIINIVSILFLLGLAVLLLYIKRHKKTKILPQIVVITTTIPFYLYNIFFITESFKAMLYITPFTYSVGLCFLPALWISIHQYFNSQSRFSKIRLIHFFPAFICFLIYSAYINRLTIPEQINFFVYKNTPWANLIDGLNLIMLITQIIIYFSIILLYLHRVKQFIEKNYTFADWKRNLWIPKILIAITITFIILLICHSTFDYSWTWTLNIFDIIIMLYFTYNSTNSPYTTQNEYINDTLTDIQFDYEISRGKPLSNIQAKEISNITKEYLKSSQSYLNPALTIKDVADAIGVSNNQISQALETIDKSNFTTIVNKLRIERAVKALSQDIENNQNIDSLTYQSGFTSRKAFFLAFKNIMGKTPVEFLMDISNNNKSIN